MIASVFCIFFFCIIQYIDTANILAVFPTPSISHQVVFRPLMHELAKRGHQVTVITTDPAFPEKHCPANLTEIDVHDVSYELIKKYVETADGDTDNVKHQISTVISVMFSIFEAQFNTDKVQKFINDKSIQIDLLFLEHFVRPVLSYSHLYNVPVIVFNSFGATYDTFNSVDSVKHPIIYPAPPLQQFCNMTPWERLYQWHVYGVLILYMYNNVFEKIENKQLKRIFGPEIPDLNDLKNNIQLTFLNTHRILDNNRPVSPNIIYIGGIHRIPENDLPKDLKLYLEMSNKGVIYMSFGSMILTSLFTQDMIRLITDVFSELPYNVLLKWDNDLPGCPDNVKIGKWFPQSDLLRHKNIKLFITHGGFQSISESIDAGVPLIGIPMSADQWYNVELLLKHEIGLKLHLKTLTKDKLKYAIETVISNESFRTNIFRLRRLIHDQPQSPLEEAVWWTEYVLRHGGAAHLRSSAVHMHWTEYYELDLILYSLSLILILIILLIYWLKLIIFIISLGCYGILMFQLDHAIVLHLSLTLKMLK